MIKRTLFTPLDSTVILSGIGCVFFGLYLYSQNSFNIINTHLDKPVGLHLNGEGTQKNLGNLFWAPLLDKSSIYNGDKLFANKEEDVKIKLLKSSLVVNIPKDSLVVIYEEEDSVSFSLDRGEIQVSSTSKNTQIKIKDQSGVSKVINLDEKTDLDIKKSKGGSDISVRNGKAQLLSNNGSLKSLPNKPVNKVAQVAMKNFISESQIDLSKKTKLSVIGPTSSGKVEILRTLESKAISKLDIVDGRIDVSSLSIGNYFVREEGKSDFDKITVISSNSFNPKVINNAQELAYGEPLQIEWDGLKESRYNVSVITPEGLSSRQQVLGTQAQVNVPISGEYKIQITKAGVLSPVTGREVFMSDAIFKESMDSFNELTDVSRVKDIKENKVSAKDKLLTYNTDKNNAFNFKYEVPNYSVVSKKTFVGKGRERAEVANTTITSGSKRMQLYEKNSLEGIKSATFFNGAKKEELTLRYNQSGTLTSLSFKEDRRVVDQNFVDGKLVKSKENMNIFSGARLINAASIPTSLSEFINARIRPTSPASIDASYSLINVKIKAPVSLVKSEDLIDKNDNYVKQVQFQTNPKTNFNYSLHNSKGEVVATSILTPIVDLKNYPAGEYILKVQAPRGNVAVISEKISIKPRIQVVTKSLGLEFNEKEKLFEIPLKWDSPKKENRLEVFKDGTKKAIFSKVIEGGSFIYKTKDLMGLRWKVSAEVDSVIPSKIVDIEKPQVLKKLPLSGPVVMKFQKKLGGCYEFVLPKVKFAQRYFIEVYEGSDRKKLIFNRWLNENSLCWQSHKHGKYFYRYKYFDKWGAQSPFSNMGEIIFPISPLTEF